MNRRLNTLTAWLLPLLCLRALLPAGFMPVVTETGWQMVLCSGGSYRIKADQTTASQAQVTSSQARHSSSKAGETDHGSPRVSDGPCLFALSASSALIPFVSPMDVASSIDQSFIRITRERLLARPLIRAQQSRAPPSFS